MSHAFIGRISRSYQDVSGIFVTISEDCDRIWVYEHPADDKVTRVHCHFLVIGARRDPKGYKNMSSYKACSLEGNKDHAYKTYDAKYKFECLTYFSKGVYDPVLCKKVDDLVVSEEHKALWVENANDNDNDNVNDNVSAKKVDEWNMLKKDFIESALYRYADANELTKDNLLAVRNWTLRWYWQRYGRMPMTSIYKRNASSLFYMLCIKLDRECIGMEALIDWTY